jgi:hypothetical protein
VTAAFIGGFGGWAYTAANSVAAGGRAGQGAASISPYTIAGVQYTLNTNSPRNIDKVGFTLTPIAATTVKTELVTGGGWYSCSNAAGTISCLTTAPQASAATANNLTIVAAQ